MTTVDTTTEAGDERAASLPDYATVPRSAVGPALNEQGYYVGRARRLERVVRAGDTPISWFRSPPNSSAIGRARRLRPTSSRPCEPGGC